ncbi:MAG: ribonuclease D [Armatimonadota bacterium]|nr:MAG: ribonuclease D [Armatimonadota bacterium]
MLITSTKQLAGFCKDVSGTHQLFMDTEFVREETYYPQLELVQVMADGQIGLVDVRSTGNLGPLLELLEDPSVEKVFHAAQQDLELFHQYAGRAVRNVFDTQIAAAMVGMGEQVGYGQLVKTLTGVSLIKTQAYTAWNTRPFTPAQLEYAADDVRHLPAVTEALKERLEEMGRTDWAREECQRLEEKAQKPECPAEELYLRVSGVERLSPKELNVLRALAIWRDETARRRNIPPQKLLKDNSLVNLARQQPVTLAEIRDLRGFPAGVAERHGAEIAETVAEALKTPKEQWPRRLPVREVDASTQALVNILATFLRIRAQERRIAWGLLATARDLEELVERTPGVGKGDLPVLDGWRYELAGRDLLRLLAGEISLTVDPVTARPVARETSIPSRDLSPEDPKTP